MKYNEIGNLPFKFVSRKQDQKYTIFKNPDEQVTLIIDTNLLNNNQSLVQEKEFSAIDHMITYAQDKLRTSGTNKKIGIKMTSLNSISFHDFSTKTTIKTTNFSEKEVDKILTNFGVKHAIGKALTKAGDVIANKKGTFKRNAKDLYTDYNALLEIQETGIKPVMDIVDDLLESKELLNAAGIEKNVKKIKELFDPLDTASSQVDQLLTKIASKGRFQKYEAVQDQADDEIKQAKKMDERRIEKLKDLHKRRDKLSPNEEKMYKKLYDEYKAYKEYNASEVRNFDSERSLKNEQKLKEAARNKCIKLHVALDSAMKIMQDEFNNIKLKRCKDLAKKVGTTIKDIKKKFDSWLQNKFDTQAIKDNLEDIAKRHKEELDEINNDLNEFEQQTVQQIMDQSNSDGNAENVKETFKKAYKQAKHQELNDKAWEWIHNNIPGLPQFIHRYAGKDADEEYTEKLTKLANQIENKDAGKNLNVGSRNNLIDVIKNLAKLNPKTLSSDDSNEDDNSSGEDVPFSESNVYGLADHILKNFAKNQNEAQTTLVKDKIGGLLHEDEFGSLWTSNDPSARCVFESKDGKADPSTFTGEDTNSKTGGGEDMSKEDDEDEDIFSDESSEDSGDDDFESSDDDFLNDDSSDDSDDLFSEDSGDDDSDWDEDSGESDDDFDLDEDSSGDDFGDFGDEEDLNSESTSDTVPAQALEAALKTIENIVDKIK